MLTANDSETELLMQYSQFLRRDYPNEEAIWEGSPFAWIQNRSSRQKGAIGEKLISGYLALKGFDVTRSPGTDSNRVIAGKFVAIKMSSLWEGGEYKFQQIRDQNYDCILCLGISPFDVHCWVIPKQVIMDKWHSGEISSQHLGQEGSDTAWLSIKPRTPPKWVREWGGSLAEAVAKIIEITGQKPLL